MNQSNLLTLREAIAEFHQKNANLFATREIAPEAKEFFRCHDIAHVVFDCNTSLYGEGKVKLWTIFGTTLGFWQHLKGYADAEALNLFKQYSFSHLLKNIFKILANMPRIIISAKHMSKPWPWHDHDRYLDMSLDAIRKEFNIKTL